MNPIADFSDTPIWLTVIKALFIFVYLVLSTLIVIWFERRVIGRMQQRPGPNRHGPFGLLQTLADGLKLMLKEDMRPKAADAILFTLAPILWATMAFVSFAIIPVGGTITLFGHTTPMQLTDLPIAVLVVLAAAGVAAYGTVLAGWASGSTYPLLGGLRSTAQIISYEIAMGLSLVAVFLYSSSMSTSAIVKAQEHTWFAVPLFISFAIYVVTMIGETNRLPVDMAEGEGEIVGGYHTEYASMRFAMFFLGEYINMFTVSALATTLFLGGPAAPPGIASIGDGALNGGWWGLLWFTMKLWTFMFMFVWLRGSLPRTRYDIFMRFGWKFLIPVAIAWLVAVAFMRAASLGFLGSATVDIAGRSVQRANLIVLGVLLGVLLVAFLLIQRRLTRSLRARTRARSVPRVVDPFAGGHPVPPLPGQQLSEPAWATPAKLASTNIPSSTADRGATTMITDPAGEEHRV